MSSLFSKIAKTVLTGGIANVIEAKQVRKDTERETLLMFTTDVVQAYENNARAKTSMKDYNGWYSGLPPSFKDDKLKKPTIQAYQWAKQLLLYVRDGKTAKYVQDLYPGVKFKAPVFEGKFDWKTFLKEAAALIAVAAVTIVSAGSLTVPAIGAASGLIIKTEVVNKANQVISTSNAVVTAAAEAPVPLPLPSLDVVNDTPNTLSAPPLYGPSGLVTIGLVCVAAFVFFGMKGKGARRVRM